MAGQQDLVPSHRVIEDIWKQGHPNPEIADIRARYFWLVDLFERHREEQLLFFNTRHRPQEHPELYAGLPGFQLGDLAWDAKDIRENYCASPWMIEDAIAGLDNNYSLWMWHESDLTGLFKEKNLTRVRRRLACLSGILGFHPIGPLEAIPRTLLILRNRKTEQAVAKELGTPARWIMGALTWDPPEFHPAYEAYIVSCLRKGVEGAPISPQVLRAFVEYLYTLSLNLIADTAKKDLSYFAANPPKYVNPTALANRVLWQATELEQFLLACYCRLGPLLEKEPIPVERRVKGEGEEWHPGPRK